MVVFIIYELASHSMTPKSQTCKISNDIVPFHAILEGLQRVSQLYSPFKWSWIAEISSGYQEKVVVTTSLQYHCMISSLSFPNSRSTEVETGRIQASHIHIHHNYGRVLGDT